MIIFKSFWYALSGAACFSACILFAGCKPASMCVTVEGGGAVIADTGFSSDADSCADVQAGSAISFTSKSSQYEICSCTANDASCLKIGTPAVHVVNIGRGENDIRITTASLSSDNACTYRGQPYGDCLDICPGPAQDNTSLSFVYRRAVQDAAVAESAEIASTLEPVTASNASLIWNADKTRVKVVTWKSQSSYMDNILPYSQTSSNENYAVWVTLAPKMQNFCKQYMTSIAGQPDAQAKLNLRLKQRLGINADYQYDIFVELWVNPADLFRPCADPAPSDTACDSGFGSTIPTVKNIDDYKAFFTNIYYKSFRSVPGTPWTGLGYTYDWGDPANEQGESEFILSPLSPYSIEQAVPTLDYCL